MVEIAQSIAILAAGLFAGAAIYINVAEHPARMECGLPLAATVFGPSYRRAAVMQSGLALVGTVAGIVAGRLGGAEAFLVGAVLLFFVVPFTFIAIMGTNRRLLDARLERTSDEASALLVRWGRLHAVRSVAGFCSFVLFVTAVSWR